jgi:hypothetical protein
MNEAYRLAAWLQANAKHMGNPTEIAMMRRSAIVMKLLADELERRDAVSERMQRD